MTGRLNLLLSLFASLFLLGCQEYEAKKSSAETATEQRDEQKSIEAFVGSASKPATEEAAKAFEDATGIAVHLHFGGSGKMLSQMLLAERGDLYFPGSSDFMEKAKRKEAVLDDTETRVVYLVPAINVQRGNPKGIEGLKDLSKEGLRIGIARPDTVCVGLYAVEVLQHANLLDEAMEQIVTNAESCAKTAQLVALEQVDAVLGWRVFQYWNPKKIETILLKKEQVPRLGYIPIAVSSYSEKVELAKKFIAFLTSPKGKKIYRKWHYLASQEEAREFVGPDTPVGGEWKLPEKARKGIIKK